VKKAKRSRFDKKKLSPILSLILGFLMGGALIGIGIYNNINAGYNAFTVRTEEEVKADIDAKYKELSEITDKRDEAYDKNALSDEYAEYSRKLSTVENETYELEAELYKIQSGFYDKLLAEQYMGSVPFIAFGVIVIVFGIGLAMKFSNESKKNVILSVTEEK